MRRTLRNLPYSPAYDDWDAEWATTLGGKAGFRGVSVASQLEALRGGDTVELLSYPVVPFLRSGLFRTVSKAWLKISVKQATADATANAVWTSTGGLQSITTTNNAGIGQILNSATPELRFDVTAVNSTFLTLDSVYFFEVQVLMSDGSIYTVETGSFTVKRGLITATS